MGKQTQSSPKFSQSLHSSSNQVNQLNVNLAVLQNQYLQTGQSNAAQVITQVRSSIAQLHAQFLSMAPQMDALHKQMQSRKMSNKFELPTISVSVSDCVPTTSLSDSFSSGSRSPCLSSRSSSPCPSYSSSSSSDFLSFNSCDALSIISDTNSSDCLSDSDAVSEVASSDADARQVKHEEINVTTQQRRKEMGGILRRQFQSFRTILAAQKQNNASKSTRSN